jgi:riboflavin synthase
MFTGIIKDIGTVTAIVCGKDFITLSIATVLNETQLVLGSSVACNGCCLTVSKFQKTQDKNIFNVDIGPTTLSLTNFKEVQIGSYVNLEPALCFADSLGGHQVSGHIDTCGKISEFVQVNELFWRLKIIVQNQFFYYLVSKGSISVAGISLTIVNFQMSKKGTIIEFMIVPHTFYNTILQHLAPEMSIEIEFDQTVKAIASLLKTMLPNDIQVRSPLTLTVEEK